MKNITFSADERLIDGARRRAQSEHTTLNDEFRRWLEAYASKGASADRAMATVQDLQSRIRTGGQRFIRDELNER
mgnify:CR=1 FL=1